jgi:UDP-N-acetylmuramoyl-L-alanine---L-glutamate ligase
MSAPTLFQTNETVRSVSVSTSSDVSENAANQFIPQLQERFFSKNNMTLALFGFGLEGQSTYRYIRKHDSDVNLIIAEQHVQDEHIRLTDADSKVQWVNGELYMDLLPHVDIAIKSPGIPPSVLEQYKQKNQNTVWITQTQVFLSLCRDRVIGVTGTKGKSTTTSLIAHILNQSGYNTALVGNIGVPFFDFIDDDTPDKWYAAELSCHQLSDVNVSPHIAVLLNIYKDHLDYYQTFEAYCEAKYRIAKFQRTDDMFVYSTDQEEVAACAGKTQAKKMAFSVHDSQITEWLSHADPLLRGDANKHNMLAARQAAAAVGIAEDQVAAAIQSFKPLEYRLELIATYQGIDFIDDALATIPEATSAALTACRHPVATLIAGGYDRGQQYQTLAADIVRNKVRTLILFPTTGIRLEQEVSHIDPTVRCLSVSSMEEAVAAAYTYTPAGFTCLLSPAAPSFSLFKNYKDRSDQYRTYVHQKGRV